MTYVFDEAFGDTETAQIVDGEADTACAVGRADEAPIQITQCRASFSFHFFSRTGWHHPRIEVLGKLW